MKLLLLFLLPVRSPLLLSASPCAWSLLGLLVQDEQCPWPSQVVADTLKRLVLKKTTPVGNRFLSVSLVGFEMPFKVVLVVIRRFK